MAFAGDAVAQAQAQQLFDEAKKLMNEGNFRAACSDFAASQARDPAPGTLLNLANCYEKNGQTASAWATFKSAAAAAKVAGRADWLELATTRAAALESRLAHLTVRLEPADAAQVIERDGVVLTAAEIGHAVVVDPGAHHVEARGGASPQRYDVMVRDAESKVVTVAPAAGAATDATDARAHRAGSTQRTVGIVVGAVGIAGLALGTVAGIVTLSKSSSERGVCPNSGYCGDANVRSDNSMAHTWGDASTAGFIAGGALVATGAVLYFLAPETRRRGVPMLGNGTTGVAFGGAF